jgi:hypothetical protein
MVLRIPLPGFKPGKFPLLVTKLSCGRHDSTDFGGKDIFLKVSLTTTFMALIFPFHIIGGFLLLKGSYFRRKPGAGG